jgi:hypothetical protein
MTGAPHQEREASDPARDLHPCERESFRNRAGEVRLIGGLGPGKRCERKEDHGHYEKPSVVPAEFHSAHPVLQLASSESNTNASHIKNSQLLRLKETPHSATRQDDQGVQLRTSAAAPQAHTDRPRDQPGRHAQPVFLAQMPWAAV